MIDLDSPVGRRMVDAMVPEIDHEELPDLTRALGAALRVAMDDTCQTCGGKLWVFDGSGRDREKPCPTCKDGKVTPPIYALLGLETREQVGTTYEYSFSSWPTEDGSWEPSMFELAGYTAGRVLVEKTETEWVEFRESLARQGITVREVERRRVGPTEPMIERRERER